MFTLMLGLIDPLRMGSPFLVRFEAIPRAGRGQSKRAITQMPASRESEARSRPLAPPRGVEAKRRALTALRRAGQSSGVMAVGKVIAALPFTGSVPRPGDDRLRGS